MSRVPITVMGYRCERCSHEWVPRSNANGEEEPKVCPKCRSAWWNRPRKAMMPYDDFMARVVQTLTEAGHPLTWTEIRSKAVLPQAFPNNQWVHRLEKDAGLYRHRGPSGVIHWELKRESTSLGLFDSAPTEAADKVGARSRRKKGVVE